MIPPSPRNACVVATLLVVGFLFACDRSGGQAESAAVSAPSAAAVSTPPAGPATDTAPASAPTTRAATAAPPRITFASRTHDFGRIHETDVVETSFSFTNTGREKLVILQVKASCGCTTPRLDKKQYAPGESGAIRVVFDPPGTGTQRKFITVLTNTRPERTELTITADVEPFLAFEPEWLKLGVLPYGVEQRPTIVVWSPGGPIEIERVTTTSPDATARVVPLEEVPRFPVTVPAGAHLIEVLVPSDAAWGGLYFGLSVTARGTRSADGEPIRHTSSIRVAGQLFGKLRAEPDMFRFGCRPGETFERTVRLERTDGKPFEILSTTVSSRELPNAQVKIAKISPDAWEITMTATGTTAGLRCGGDVTVVTDVPGEERIDLGILGVVRNPPP